MYTDKPVFGLSIKESGKKFSNTVHSSIDETHLDVFNDPEIIRDKNTNHNFKNDMKVTNNFIQPKPKKDKFKEGKRLEFLNIRLNLRKLHCKIVYRDIQDR